MYRLPHPAGLFLETRNEKKNFNIQRAPPKNPQTTNGFCLLLVVFRVEGGNIHADGFDAVDR